MPSDSFAAQSGETKPYLKLGGTIHAHWEEDEFRSTACGMKLLIEIPEKYYNQLIAACDRNSPEYELLKNGCVAVQRYARSARRQIQILCDEEQLSMIRETAIRVCPEATRSIVKRRLLRRKRRP